MKNKTFYTILKIAILTMALNPMNLNAQTLKDAYKGKFYIGTAMNTLQIKGQDTAAINVIKEKLYEKRLNATQRG